MNVFPESSLVDVPVLLHTKFLFATTERLWEPGIQSRKKMSYLATVYVAFYFNIDVAISCSFLL